MRVKIILFIILSVLLLLFNGCRKHSELHEDITSIQDAESFFQLPVNASPQLQNLALDIKKQDALYKFIGAFSKRNGYPVWDKVLSNLPVMAPGDSTSTNHNAGFLIPLKIPNGSISAYIACLQTDTGYAYRLYSRPAVEAANLDTANQSNSARSLPAMLLFGYFEKVIC